MASEVVAPVFTHFVLMGKAVEITLIASGKLNKRYVGSNNLSLLNYLKILFTIRLVCLVLLVCVDFLECVWFIFGWLVFLDVIQWPREEENYF